LGGRGIIGKTSGNSFRLIFPLYFQRTRKAPARSRGQSQGTQTVGRSGLIAIKPHRADRSCRRKLLAY